MLMSFSILVRLYDVRYGISVQWRM